MTDIVERLTRAADLLETGQYDIINTSMVKEAAAEIDRLRAASQWQPIETAPKDPSRYLVLRCVQPGPTHTCIGVWMYSHWKAIHSDVRLNPIAWQPLPSPPTQEGGE